MGLLNANQTKTVCLGVFAKFKHLVSPTIDVQRTHEERLIAITSGSKLPVHARSLSRTPGENSVTSPVWLMTFDSHMPANPTTCPLAESTHRKSQCGEYFVRPALLHKNIKSWRISDESSHPNDLLDEANDRCQTTTRMQNPPEIRHN
jgi:hypothetical protein